MRGANVYNDARFSTLRLDDLVRAKYPLRPICQFVKSAISKMGEKCSDMYQDDIRGGRSSLATEKPMPPMRMQLRSSVRGSRKLLLKQIQIAPTRGLHDRIGPLRDRRTRDRGWFFSGLVKVCAVAAWPAGPLGR